MSQDTFPFAEGDEAPAVSDDGDSRNRKAVLVAGGVAAALVLGVGGWFFLGGSSDTTAAAAFVPSQNLKPAAVAPTKVITKPAKKLPAAYKVNLGRDPFHALYVVPAAAPVTAAPAASPAPGAPGTTGAPGTQVGTTHYTLKLVSINSPKPGDAHIFTWLVDGKRFDTIASQRFGKVGELVVLTYEKNSANKAVGAIIQVGDDSPIDVLIGESISVL